MLKNKKQKAAEKIKQKSKIVGGFAYVILLSLAITSLMVLYIDRLPSNIQEGAIATQDIRADQNYEIIDEKATEKLKKEAASKSLSVYNFDISLVLDRKQKIKLSFLEARNELEDFASKNADEKKLTDELESQIKKDFLINLGMTLDEPTYNIIRKDKFSEELENSLLVLTTSIQKKPIIFDKSELAIKKDFGIVLRTLADDPNNIKEEIVNDFSHILSLEEAQNYYSEDNINKIQKQNNLEFMSSDKIKTAIKLVPYLIKVNVVVDKIETDFRKERALSNVQSIIYKLQKGQIIIRRGDRYENRHIIILDGIHASRLQTNLVLKFLGVFCLILSSLLIIYFFASRTLRDFKPTRKDLNFLGLMIILFLAILRLGSFVGSSIQGTVPFTVDITTFYYVIPIAAGAMMVRFILNPIVAFVFCVVLSFFSGLFLEHNYQLTTYYFLSCVVGCLFIGGVERRSSVLRRGLYVGLTNIVIVLSLNLITTISTTSSVDVQALIVNCAFAFFGGVLAALLLLAISPIMEAVFNYTTNIQLLELANMNHPLLREMIVRAPGTYLHSQLVGTLAEAGTRSIGGNSLLARVGSYYHDIGKMKKPQYFIENQKGENPHNNLAPSMSALIIDAHVKDGIEMAKEYKLPKVIADFIPEHQGTKLIGYFYHKAKQEAGDDKSKKDKIDERNYRYKGPRPQSRESGVVMLADTIEAAVRSMPDKSPQKIRAQVEKLVNAHFVDGQLDECDLTLKDLHIIVDAFVKILIGIYHQRVEYPEGSEKTTLPLAMSEKDESKENYNRQVSAASNSNISPLFKEKR